MAMAEHPHVVVLGAGPAGSFAALRAADLGAITTLVTSDVFGGMSANDGPVPVRTLAHAARLMREVDQLPAYGIDVGRPRLDYGALLGRVSAVVRDVGRHSALREQIDAAGVTVHENTGASRFIDANTIETSRGTRFEADRFILCTGGKNRGLPVPGFELVATHSDAWSLQAVPPSMMVIGGGATGMQVASIFAAFGSKVSLFQADARIIPSEDPDVSADVAAAFRARGIEIYEGFGSIEQFEAVPEGIRMRWSNADGGGSSEAALAISAVGWRADAEALNLEAIGVATNPRGFIAIDENGKTSVPHIFAAGDVRGGPMLAPQAMQDGFIAASAALGAPVSATARHLIPVGSFTDPEYARVGMTEASARAGHGILVQKVPFAAANRAIIDGRITGFCKLVIDRTSRRILGCSIVGERAVDIVQVAAVAMAADMDIHALAHFPLSFPTYAGILSQAAAKASYALNHQ